jgi:hypothetical protein
LVGILNSEFEGKRSYVDVYGFTEILPGRITTDRIASADGNNFIDLLNNAFKIGNSDSSLDWNVTVQNVLSLLNVAIKLGISQDSTGIQLNPDGSGSLGNGNFSWNTAGDINMTGAFNSNKYGSKIGINPTGRYIDFVDPDGNTVAYMSFYQSGKSSDPNVFFQNFQDGVVQGAFGIFGNRIRLVDRNAETVWEMASYSSGKLYFYIKPDSLPTSGSGLLPGVVWRDGTTLKIAQ